MIGDNFYIVLPSSVDTPLYPDNTITHYVTPLPQKLELDENWECGLAELSYCHSWHNVVQDFNWIYIRIPHEDSTLYFTYRIDIPPRFYTSENQVLKTINKLLKDEKIQHEVKFSFSVEEGSVYVIECKRGIKMSIDKELAEFLGIDNIDITFDEEDKNVGSTNTDDSWYAYYGDHAVDVYAKHHSLLVYSDIIRETIVGNTFVPLLRQIYVKKYKEGSYTQEIFQNIHYIPLQSGKLSKVEIRICDITGKPMRFNYGHLSVILHFRRKNINL